MCTNRDEYLSRPTADAHFHDFDHGSSRDRGTTPGQILSGIDLRGGGTWLGLKRSGRLAVLTNITEPYQTFESTRGTLVSSFLLSEESSNPLKDEVGKIIPQDAKFAGFNLLLLAPQKPLIPLNFDASFVSNNGAGGTLHHRSLDADERACGCFSNGIDAEGGGDWPKVKRGKEIFASIINKSLDETALTARLFGLLTEHSPEPVKQRADLRRTIQVLPFSISESTLPEADRVYGTRLSTVIFIGVRMHFYSDRPRASRTRVTFRYAHTLIDDHDSDDAGLALGPSWAQHSSYVIPSDMFDHFVVT